MDGQLKRVALLLFIAGPPLLLWIHAFSGFSRYGAMRSWPRTMAIVQDVRIGAAARGHMPLQALVSFDAAGRPVKAWVMVPMRADPPAKKGAGAVVPYDYLDDRFAVGQSIEVFYNPKAPREAYYLAPSLRPPLVATAAGFVWLAACAAALLL